MLRFFTYVAVAVFATTLLQADDRGFRLTSSFTSMGGFVERKLSLKTAIQSEMTYLIFNQLEFGVGLGYHRQQMTRDRNENFDIAGDTSTYRIFSIRADSFPYYAVLRYNFDIFEDGWVVAAVKYGHYYLLPKDRLRSGSLPSIAAEGETAPTLRFENEITNAQIMSATLGYNLDNVVVSLEYRRVSFDQRISYIDNTNFQTVKNSYNRTNQYYGINIAYALDLF
ncbi:MAG: hypothetical protein LBQ34_03635 [Alphaproteobacteria bacterium]|jgi:hypothetical protein|nr:hypothetical protein [Alphaproteobacteria bacterium]